MSDSAPPASERRRDPFFRWGAHARAHLDRAVELLRRFDEHEDVSALFYAALELRFGIEARLLQYLDAALQSRDLAANVKEHAATKLLSALTRLDPKAEVPSVLTITEEGVSDPDSTRLAFTPVSSQLAGYHGRLGGMLHTTFFRQNPRWLTKSRTAAGIKGKTLLHQRDFLQLVVQELRAATSGTLLGHPVFTELVDELLAELPEEPSDL